ncbi:uncharacterized protein LTR77_003185 [Saxophila tyrrhenica]|uniref:Uncharacterized protein n=1 Tax=Saxophila tyrrhenica TaxID=1690608 RepID=A0AAV9PLC5_9PEZI|nr:hypothetical protein LTR77_003185 [Saxophila tyrrhenica]
MSIGEGVVDTKSCVAAIISAYHDGATMVQRIKAKRARDHVAPPPRVLEESIDQAPDEIQRGVKKGAALVGEIFERGDQDAITALQQVAISLQKSLLRTLGDAMLEDDATVDYEELIDAVDACRNKTIEVLLALGQRLLQSDAAVEDTNGSLTDGQSTGDEKSIREKSVLKSSTEPSPTREPPPIHRRTWTREYGGSGDEDDTEPGADDPRGRFRRRRHYTASLLGFLKHDRNKSGTNDISAVPSRRTSASPIRDPSWTGTPSRRHTRNASTITQELENESPPNFTFQEGDDYLRQHSVETSRGDTLSIAPDALLAPATAQPRDSSLNVPHPSPANSYLGFCPGAWRLQTGDRTGALKTCKEFNDGWSHSRVYYLACTAHKCVFAAHMDISIIWNKVWKLREDWGVKFRWTFLAKSHISQNRRMAETGYVYRCMFCVLLGKEGEEVWQGNGAEAYLEHIAREHRGQVLGDVVCYKLACVNDRICADDEDFDINLYPTVEQEDFAFRGGRQRDGSIARAATASFEAPIKPEPRRASGPWNEGLSDFHEGGEIERTERE